ncbi:unnamed protein product [Arctogadus glacialis]
MLDWILTLQPGSCTTSQTDRCQDCQSNPVVYSTGAAQATVLLFHPLNGTFGGLGKGARVQPSGNETGKSVIDVPL